MTRDKKPYYRWYPGDLRRDAAVQSCAWDIRAVWREMLDLMHDGEPRGFLTAGGVPIKTGKELSIAIGGGIPAGLCQRAIDMVKAKRICGVTEEGVIFSRRMVRDEELDKVRGEGGSKGGRKVTEKVGAKVGGEVTPSPAFPPDPPITPAPGTGNGTGERDARANLPANLPRCDRRSQYGPGAGAGSNPRDHLNCRQPCIRVCLSERQHAVLRERHGGTDADMDAFYAEVRQNIAGPVGMRAWEFWESQFIARFGTTVNPKTAGNAAAAARFATRGQS